MKNKSHKLRNLQIVDARSRVAAGPMKAKREWEKNEQNTTRDWVLDAEVDGLLHEEEIRLSWCEDMERLTDYSGSGCYCSDHEDGYEDYRKGHK